jgi:hypothetical protein
MSTSCPIFPSKRAFISAGLRVRLVPIANIAHRLVFLSRRRSATHGLELREVVEMPVNNLSLVFVKAGPAVPA